MHYQNKPLIQNSEFQAAEFVTLGKEKKKKKESYSFRQLYCSKRPQGLEDDI